MHVSVVKEACELWRRQIHTFRRLLLRCIDAVSFFATQAQSKALLEITREKVFKNISNTANAADLKIQAGNFSNTFANMLKSCS